MASYQDKLAFGRQIYDYFLAKGLPPHQAAAIAGNMTWEGGGRSNLVNSWDNRKVYASPHSVGVGQWNDRSQGVFDLARARGIDLGKGDLRDPRYVQAAINKIPLDVQLDYAWQEMQGPERRAFYGIQRSPDLQSATANAISYHRPADWTWSRPWGGHGYAGRLALARGIMDYNGPAATGREVATRPGNDPFAGRMSLGAVPSEGTEVPGIVTDAPRNPPPTQAPPAEEFPADATDAAEAQRAARSAAAQAADAQHWDAIQRQAEANQARIEQGRDPITTGSVTPAAPVAPATAQDGWFGPMGSGAQFTDAGDFFRNQERWGYKGGGAVKAPTLKSKEQVKYRGHPFKGQRCGYCTMFRKPAACTDVKGSISPYGYCDIFYAAPTAVAKFIKREEAKVAQPTEAQKEAGNYAKGHVSVHGLDITIENPKGSQRSGTDPNGKRWAVTMPATYGYVKRTVGRDGDHVDVYLGGDHGSDRVFGVDQIDAKTGKFDEHKFLLSFPDEASALKAYKAAFSDGKGGERIGAVTEMSVAGFRRWLEKGDTKKPLGTLVRKRDAGGRVQDLDALSAGLGKFTPEELARAKANREAALRQRKYVTETLHNNLGGAALPGEAMSEEHMRDLSDTMQELDRRYEYRRADGGAISIARKYSKG